MPTELTEALGRSLEAATVNHLGVSTTGRRETIASLRPPEAMQWQEAQGRMVGLRHHPAGLFLWRSPLRGLMVPRRDTTNKRFMQAARALNGHGWPVTPRACGGTAFPVDTGTLQMAVIWPKRSTDTNSMERIYKSVAAVIVDSLATFGVKAHVGRVSNAFCDGRYDVSVDGRKIAGISQSWKGSPDDGYVLATATLMIAGPSERLVRPVNAFYDALAEPAAFQIDAITSFDHELGGHRHEDSINGLNLISAHPAHLDGNLVTK